MQQQPIGWDPISIDHIIPLQLRLLYIYLFPTTAIWFIRSFSLVGRLWPLFGRKLANGHEPGVLASPGLADRLNNSKDAKSRASAIDAFEYLWGMSSIDTDDLKRMAVLTLMVTTILVAWLLANDLSVISESKFIGIGMVSGSAAEVLAMFAVGGLFSALFYGSYAVFKGALARRRVRWNRYCAEFSVRRGGES